MGHNMTGPLPDRFIDGDNYTNTNRYGVWIREKQADGHWWPVETLAEDVSSDEAEQIAMTASARLGLPYTVDN